MTDQLEVKEMVQRVLAISEILATVATSQEIKVANQGASVLVQCQRDSSTQQPCKELKQ
ncbi:MAG: hypothetical protein K8I82_05010 [Anaerolineae bacterium]|nr:hypothetical protein [Anaerolineae bacterium]